MSPHKMGRNSDAYLVYRYDVFIRLQHTVAEDLNKYHQ